MNKNAFTEIVGWYGVAAILGAYILANFEVLEVSDLPYLLLNATGAAGIIIDSSVEKNWQPVVLNAVWLLVALVSVFKTFI